MFGYDGVHVWTGQRYTISGRITIGDTSEGLEGVTVVSDGFGYVRLGWKLESRLRGVVKVSAEKGGWTFEPESWEVTETTTGLYFKATRVEGSLFDC